MLRAMEVEVEVDRNNIDGGKGYGERDQHIRSIAANSSVPIA